MTTSTSDTSLLAAVALGALAAILTVDSICADPERASGDKAAPLSGSGLEVASFTDAGALVRPENLDQWVFLGAALGMDYREAKFDPNSPGDFQIVLMEPKAYAYFKAHNAYADGSMFLLSLYHTQPRLSIAEAGFAQGDLKAFEIHLIDRRRFAEGRAFYLFERNGGKAAALPPGSPCVECHLRDAAFDGTFAQFYPAIRHRIPSELLEKSMRDGTRH